MAKLLPIAFPPIVNAAIIAATVSVVGNTGKLASLINIAAMVVPTAPEMIPQISHITSQQKLDTLSALFLNFTATEAPFTFLELME